MSKQLRQLFRNLLWLGGLVGLAVVVILLLSNSRANRTAQFPEPTPVPLSTATPTPVVFSSPFDSPVETPPPGATATSAPPPTETPWVEPPTPTVPPVPTPLPTPVVTPIPTVAPPVIPDVVGIPLQPFWIYYWRDNEVWRIDSQGQNRELLLDTFQSVGQWLTGHPMAGTDCCWSGPRVVVSPDGQKLALVVVDKIQISKGEPFTFSIYVFDLQTQDLSFISEGVQPAWSPDGQRLAFLKENGFGGLWIADLENKQVREQVIKHEDSHMHIAEIAWSSDGTQIAYYYLYGAYQYVSTIWLIGTDEGALPRQLFSLDSDYPLYGITWSPDGQQIFFLSLKGGRDASSYHAVQNLWSVSVATATLTQLTQDMVVEGYFISPNTQWLFFSGYHLYEQSQEIYDRSLWLLSIDGQDLRRVTAPQGIAAAAGWTPDGTRLVVWREGTDPILYSLEDRTITVLDFDLGSNFGIGGAK